MKTFLEILGRFLVGVDRPVDRMAGSGQVTPKDPRYLDPDPAGREERLRNQKDAGAVAGLSLCLIGDVWTTGATTEECAKTLLQAGAKRCWF